jgi:pyrimidine-nucleoside phosphorylase
MRPVDIIRKKRDGETLSAAEIDAFVRGATTGSWPDYQSAALLMAIWLRRMDAAETAELTRAMVASGRKLDLSDIPGPKVDKHSTGGVGDKTSVILAPLAAACGVVVPMISGRGLGHTGGTLDKLESIPGFRAGLSLDEFRQALRDVGCALIGQTAEIAPADKVLYALRDVTATVESIPLITASIMSKKLAEGIDALVLDVKTGRGAFMKTRRDARSLAESLVATGKANGVRSAALITSMDAPLGRAIGNALEMQESIETLRGDKPGDLEGLSVALAARMVVLGGRAATLGEATLKVYEALQSGRGLRKLQEIIARQGGDPRVVDDTSRLPQAPDKMLLRAERSGYIVAMDAEKMGRATMLLGAGRERVEHTIDAAVGAVLALKAGDQVHEGEALVEIHYGDATRLAAALPLFREAWTIGDAPAPQAPRILDTLGDEL